MNNPSLSFLASGEVRICAIRCHTVRIIGEIRMLSNLLFAIWYFLPAGLANSSPIVAKKLNLIPWFDKPIDMGRSFGGIRIFGDHKTWRGLIVGIMAGIFGVWVEKQLYINFAVFRSISHLDYRLVNPVTLGFLLGFGAIAGDAIKSFIKRRVHIASGETMLVWDQLDYIVGGLVMSSFYIDLRNIPVTQVFVFWLLAHLVSSYVGWKLGMKKSAL